MKFELSEKEKKRLDHAMENNPIRRYLANRENLNFELGDVLIKTHKRIDYSTKVESWQPETVSSENKMAQRYVFIAKDEFGIGYVKQLKVSTGKLGEEIYCLADYDYASVRFMVDPEYAELLFLDADFDIKEVHKKSLEARKIITKMNRKTGTKPKSLKEFNDFFSKLKVGDKFFVSSDYTAKWTQEYDIVDIIQLTHAQMDQTRDWQWDRMRRDQKQDPAKHTFIDHPLAIKIKYNDNTRHGSSTRENYCWDFGRDYVFYTSKPAQEDKK